MDGSFLVYQGVAPLPPGTVSHLAVPVIGRRFVWNFFRLENEHLNNCGKFRAVRDISVAPIDASDQAEVGYRSVRYRDFRHT